MNNYSRLEKIFHRRSCLSHLKSICYWDMATHMPHGGGESRAEALAELDVIQQDLLLQPQMAEWIHEAKNENLNEWQRANLREMEREWIRAKSIDADLSKALTIAGARCEMAWRKLRAENNWKDYLPLQAEVFRLTFKKARELGEALGLSPYDAMIDTYEPGSRAHDIRPLFDDLKSFLPEFINQVLDLQKSRAPVLEPKGPFATDKQKALGEDVMKILGFDFHHGRLDTSIHPFCGGVPQDVRITTRYDENDFVSALLGVVHETGHALYEQNLPAEWLNQPIGAARGMALHESQSLLHEMQLGRSEEFLCVLQPLVQKYFGGVCDAESLSASNLRRLMQQVEKGYIRVEADEATYPLHVILRFEIESALVTGDLPIEDLPAAWDEKMRAYLNLSTKDNFKDGCMQDIHWTDGTVGYFPSYTLGAMTAAQFFAEAKVQIDGLMDDVKRGELARLRTWLKENIWSQGSRWTTNELLQRVTGSPLSTEPFKRHLRARYLG